MGKGQYFWLLSDYLESILQFLYQCRLVKPLS